MNGPSFSIRFILMFAVGILTVAIVWLASARVYTEWKIRNDIVLLYDSTYLNEKIFDTIQFLTVERDLGLSALSEKDKGAVDYISKELKKVREQSEASLKNVISQLDNYELQNFSGRIEYMKSQVDALNGLRNIVDRHVNGEKLSDDDVDKWFENSTDIIRNVYNFWMAFTAHFTDIDTTATQRIFFTHLLGSVMEYSGRERALIGSIITANKPVTQKDRERLLLWHSKADYGWQLIEQIAQRGNLAPEITPYISDAKSHYANIYDMVKNTFYSQYKGDGTYFISTDFWLEFSGQATDSLYILKDFSLKKMREHVERLKADAQQSIIINFAILLMAIVLCLYSFNTIHTRVLMPIHNMVNALVETMKGRNVVVPPAIVDRKDEIGELGKVLHAFQQNVEAVKKTSAKLERYVKDLERSNKELDDFAYIASHDLKEPLRGIHNHSRFLMEDNAEKLDEESRNRLQRLVHLSQRMEALVNDLLYFSRLGRQEFAIQTTNLNDVIEDIKVTLELFLKDHKAEIRIPRQLPTIVCDNVRVTEVFRNLITNAVKYNESDFRVVEIGFLDGRKDNKGNYMMNVFYVKDNGMGIAPEFHEEIFRIFRRLQSPKGTEEEGTGVGLTFVKKIVERHGGKIWLESEQGKGTTFYFTLEV